VPKALIARKPHPKNAEWRVVTIGTLVEVGRGETIPGETKDYIVFAGKLADGLELGKPLPEGTTEEPPKFEGAMPSLKLPRPGGGGQASWRNTKEGAEYESESIRRHQEIEEERRDRRTALMQAVIKFTSDDQLEGADLYPSSLLKCADEFYAWLRESVSGGPSAKTSVSAAGVAEPRTAQGPPSDTRVPRGSDRGGTPPVNVDSASAEPTLAPGDTPSSPAAASAASKGDTPPAVAERQRTVERSTTVMPGKQGLGTPASPAGDISSGEEANPPISTERGASSEDRREGDAGDSGVGVDTPGGPGTVAPKAAQTPGSPSRRQRCFHTEGIKVVEKESGGSVTVCKRCGVVLNV
jgi:hypothetical protein